MLERRRLAVFGVLLLACALVAGVAVVSGVQAGDPARSVPPAARDAFAAAAAGARPTVLFRNLANQDSQLGMVSATDPGGARTLLPLRCDRVYLGAGAGLCLARGSGFAEGYQVKVLDDRLRVRHTLDLEGVPSRARVSPDGRYGTVTFFVAGHSYAAQGTFSTRTTLIDLASGSKIADLEQFSVTKGSRLVTAVDMNFWGVTFEDDGDGFYATLATGGKTYLIHGSVRERKARVLHENVECPSVSPDGTRVAYKRRTGSATKPWRLTVLDLATMKETPLAEARSVDDQAEWLDDDTVLYGVDGDVYAVPADGGGAPRRFIADADSPVAVRW